MVHGHKIANPTASDRGGRDGLSKSCKTLPGVLWFIGLILKQTKNTSNRSPLMSESSTCECFICMGPHCFFSKCQKYPLTSTKITSNILISHQLQTLTSPPSQLQNGERSIFLFPSVASCKRLWRSFSRRSLVGTSWGHFFGTGGDQPLQPAFFIVSKLIHNIYLR